MKINASTSIDELIDKLLNDVLDKNNFSETSSGKGSFLTGGSVIVCESTGLQEYIQKKCADKYGIWAALSYKPLAGLLMRCAYNLSVIKKDESKNVFNKSNLVWAIYRLLEGERKTFFFANELASLFLAYQIYRPKMIRDWNNGTQHTIPGADSNFINNEKFQRELWVKLKKEHGNEQDISQLYELFEKCEKKLLPKRIFIFAPVSIAPIHLEALKLISDSGCNVHLYISQISNEYIGDAKNEKSIAFLRKKAWGNNKIADDKKLYWDLGNNLIANLGRSAQVLFEQIGWENFEYNFNKNTENSERRTMLSIMKENILNDINPSEKIQTDDSITFNNCFSPLREVEVLCDYILELFNNDSSLTPCDIAVVSPNMETYANAAEAVFLRYNIPILIADRDVQKHDKTARLLNMLFSLCGSRYEAPDICALFEYSRYVQDNEFEADEIDRLHKWINENAVRHGIEGTQDIPDYSFETGLKQLAAGFFMISEKGFSDKDDYCYPDIEGADADIFGDFACFVETLKIFDLGSHVEKTIQDWDNFLKENLKAFFGTDEVNFNEESENPYQRVISAWDSLMEEMFIGFNFNTDIKIDFAVLKSALLNKAEQNSQYHYSASGKISFANIETMRAVPHKVICFIGMNGKEYPRQIKYKEISLMKDYILGDKDSANEDRLIFLETILNAKEKLYISWIGQNEKTSDELEPSGVVVGLLKYLNGQPVKHPLQPFSDKYYNGELNRTYDTRWDNTGNTTQNIFNVWKWEIKKENNDFNSETFNLNLLISIFNDVSKYFIKTRCNIYLQDGTGFLENIEPFVLDNPLIKWILTSTILDYYDNDEYLKKIKINKRRGELPDGKFAQYSINKIIENAKTLKKTAKNEKEGTYWIIPSRDSGKYRLRHWLYHLNLNANIKDNQSTKMFLFDKEPLMLELNGMSKEKAGKLLNNLWQLKNKLDNRLIPVFPNAAWIYVNDGIIEDIETFIEYSQYARMVFKDIEAIEGDLKEEFTNYSEILFNEYFNYEVQHETA